MNDAKTTIQELRLRMKSFVAARQWEKYHRPKNLAMSLAIEAGELMEQFQWLDHDETEQAIADPDVRREIADEISDVLAFLLSLANAVDIDISSAFEDKMSRNELKYPPQKYQGTYRRPKRDK